MQTDTQVKYQRLLELLRGYGCLAVAFSGGVDSALLLFAAHEALGDRAVAITVRTLSYPRHEEEDAARLLKQIGVRSLVLEVDQLAVDGFAANGPLRCYYCKKALFSSIAATAAELGCARVADGANVDDEGDYRPGMQAVAELGIQSPLRQVGLTKAEVRQLSRERGLFTWSKPSYACLASRVPYGEEITAAKLRMIEQAEAALLELGFAQMRVRCHGTLARIEVPAELIEKIAQPELRQKITGLVKNAGFTFVSLDLEGFRSGSMNETLTAKDL